LVFAYVSQLLSAFLHLHSQEDYIELLIPAPLFDFVDSLL